MGYFTYFSWMKTDKLYLKKYKNILFLCKKFSGKTPKTATLDKC